jgi:hypothetical protein
VVITEKFPGDDAVPAGIFSLTVKFSRSALAFRPHCGFCPEDDIGQEGTDEWEVGCRPVPHGDLRTSSAAELDDEAAAR